MIPRWDPRICIVAWDITDAIWLKTNLVNTTRSIFWLLHKECSDVVVMNEYKSHVMEDNVAIFEKNI